jgi:hypothetical protein
MVDANSPPAVFPGRPVGLAILALVLGALLTLGALLGYYLVLERHGRAESMQFGPDRLRLVLGTGEERAEGIAIDGLDPERGFAQISSSMTYLMQAQRLGELRWRIDGLHPGIEIELLWIDQFRQFHRVPLEHAGGSRGRLLLADTPDWQGVITGIGLLVANPTDEPLVVRELVLRPVLPDSTELLDQLWQQWTAVEGWRGYSEHLIVGGAGVLIGPTPVAALWVGSSLLVYLLLGGWRRSYRLLTPLGLVVLAGWLALDLRWQWTLGEQLETSLEQLAGQDLDDKLRSYDDDLIDLINAVRPLLPEQPARIFLISNDVGGYRHGRARYHLIPHNVYGFSANPPLPRWTRPGDYLLALLPLEGISYRQIPGNQALLWENNELPVELLLAEHKGLLFRIRETP